MHALDGREELRIDDPRERELDGARCLPAQRLDRAGDDEVPVLDDRDAGRDALHLVEFVRREEDGRPSAHELTHETFELALHQGVKSRCGLVEDDQFGSMHHGEQNADLLPIAFGERASGPLEVDLEPVRQFIEEGSVLHPADLGSEVDVLLPRQARVQCELPWKISDASMNLDGIGNRVKSESLCGAGRRVREAGQETDGR